VSICNDTFKKILNIEGIKACPSPRNYFGDDLKYRRIINLILKVTE